MPIREDAEFNFAKQPFYFAFRPEVDDFDAVHIERTFETGPEWQLSPNNPFVGRQCLELRGDPNTKASCWVFSRAFNFYKSETYEAIIHYRGSPELEQTQTENNRSGSASEENSASIGLWLGKDNTPNAMTRLLIENGISHGPYQYLKVRFNVEEDDCYYFGGLGKISLSNSTIAMGDNLVLDTRFLHDG